MAKMMLVILTLIFINGCGEKQIELTPKVNDTNTTTVTVDESKDVVLHEAAMVSDFVPPHIANSTIEVVPH